MEGKETRFGIANSALWATATTAASNGSVNSMHDSFTPLGGLVPMWLMQLGEVVFGGVGSGLYGMLMFAIVAVFIAGLMVGRTPEYLGKKIEAYEMKMASLVLLIPCLVVLVGTAIASVMPAGTSSVRNPGPHGFSEILYAFSSAGNNNGSAFASISANTPFYNLALGIAMWMSRYWLMIPVLAIAGSLAAKRATAVTAGTLPTHTPLFVVMLVGVVLMVGALTFVPALALGPIVEHLQMTGARLKAMTHSTTADGRPRPDRDWARSGDSFRKLDPRVQFRNPVMFVVFVGSILTTVIGIAAAARRAARMQATGFVLAIAAWLWLTVLFANFAEAVAEGRGKAQAATLRSMRRHVHAKRLSPRQTAATTAASYQTVEAARCGATTSCWSRRTTSSPPTARSSKASPRSTKAR